MMRARRKYIILIAILVLFYIFVVSLSVSRQQAPIQYGVADLSTYDFNKNTVFTLNGKWDFYWRQLLYYPELRNVAPDLCANVPDMWTKYELNGNRLPGIGYATYRLHVITDLYPGTQLGLKMNALLSASRLYINDSLIAGAGVVAADALHEIGSYKPLTVYFPIPAREFDIIIHISNYEYARGGFHSNLYLGNADSIGALHAYSMGRELFLLGVLVIVSLFYLAIFLMRTELLSYLYFSCLAILAAIMVDIVGENIIIGRLDYLSLDTVIFFWYLSTNWVPFFYLLFTHELMKTRFSGISIKIYLLITAILQLLFILIPPTEYSHLTFFSNLHDLFGYLLAFAFVMAGMRKGYKDGWLHLLNMFIALICYLHDLLYLTNIINDNLGETLYAGMFQFIFFQMIVQINYLKRFYDSNKALEIAFLQAQIKPHFLYNTINSFIAVSYDSPEEARHLMTDFAYYLRRSFDFKNMDQFVNLSDEIELVRHYINIEKVRFEERLEVTYDICEDTDIKIPSLILQPIIENAIIHGILPQEQGGLVAVSIKKDNRMLEFKVQDNGTGMTQDRIKTILKNNVTEGVGLYNINNRLYKLYGTGLHIISIPGNGTEVSWSIPLTKKTSKINLKRKNKQKRFY